MPQRIDPNIAQRDSIIFLALCSTGGRVCVLWQIIWLYDWLNRDIPSMEDLDSGLNRLLALRLLELYEDGFRIPNEVVNDFRVFRQRRRQDRFKMAKQFVESKECLKSVKRRVTITKTDHREALAEYRRVFKEACQKSDRT